MEHECGAAESSKHPLREASEAVDDGRRRVHSRSHVDPDRVKPAGSVGLGVRIGLVFIDGIIVYNVADLGPIPPVDVPVMPVEREAPAEQALQLGLDREVIRASAEPPELRAARLVFPAKKIAE